MIGKRETLAAMQSNFYREKYRKILRLLLVSVCVMIILIGVVIYLLMFQAAPRYYANTLDGKILPLQIKSGR